MAKKKWNDLTNRQKSLIIGGSALDAALRVWAGRDLASRSAAEVNGPKWLWGVGLSAVNSAGVLPVVYLVKGRRARTSVG
ncbi:hypothetical protein JVX90_14130 [Gordonia sp. PDNC005]|jgi:hypothetical protein|uniref:hypothetical protein n=1 Tax=unclassified Gordonia (in: high G+C Gram-positive bacteria) TaxID=2657482 RepID=UPI00196324EA|nr:hypothetical protein [Gordonia sp. PDNC005]QRY61548.1 hypothetical protein JVX90_14130 [Gordonia sp. PDNC005]